MSIKIAEIFGGNKKGGTIQGEGLHMGISSTFVRTFGCNKTCSGFGMPMGQKSEERFKILPESLTRYEDAELVKSGCDSFMSWDSRFKQFSPEQTISQIVDRIENLLQNGKFNQNCHLILTGGEPLLGWQKQYPALLDEIYNRNMGLTDLTFETNGTLFLTKELEDYLNISSGYGSGTKGLITTFSVSPKLPCSGETWESSILPDRIIQYQNIHRSNIYLKFVVSTNKDVEDVHKAVKEYQNAGFTGPVYLMPVGGVNEVYELNAKNVAEMAIENGYRYSARLQVDLFKNAWNF